MAAQVRVERCPDGGIDIVNDGPHSIHQPVVEAVGPWVVKAPATVRPPVVAPGRPWRAGYLPADWGTDPTRPAYRVQLSYHDDGGLGADRLPHTVEFDL